MFKIPCTRLLQPFLDEAWPFHVRSQTYAPLIPDAGRPLGSAYTCWLYCAEQEH